MGSTRILSGLTGVSLAISAALSLSNPSSAADAGGCGTLVVDDDGGADFTEIQDAVTAAANGALIVVEVGQYDPFVIDDKRLTILGEAGVHVRAGTQILGLSSGQRVALVDLALTTLVVFDCRANVLLENVDVDESVFSAPAGEANLVFIGKSDDVEMRDCDIGQTAAALGRTAVSVDDSEVDLVSCDVVGSDGPESDPLLVEDGGDAGFGLRVRNGSAVSLARTRVTGGAGGNENGGGDQAGHGGDAVRLEGSSTATVSGSPGHFLKGGEGGISVAFGQDGRGGHGTLLVAGGQNALRLSGATALDGLAGSGGVDGEPISLDSADSGGTLDLPAVPDPTLEILGTPVLGGGPIKFRVFGPIGSKVTFQLTTLALGAVPPGPLPPPVPTGRRRPATPSWAPPPGVISTAGFLDYLVFVGAYPPGQLFSGSALVELPQTGEQRSTNAASSVLRCP